MIFSNILSSATSSSIHGSERLPEIAKSLAPYAEWVLKEFRHEDELWLDLFTGLVVLGVALEVVEIIHELREKFGPFKIFRPDKKWIPVVGFIGWLIVVVGVAGELVFESKLNTKTEELEEIGDALLADAQLTSSDATKEAGAAKQSAIDAAEQLQLAQERMNGIEKSAGELDRRIIAMALCDVQRIASAFDAEQLKHFRFTY